MFHEKYMILCLKNKVLDGQKFWVNILNKNYMTWYDVTVLTWFYLMYYKELPDTCFMW